MNEATVKHKDKRELAKALKAKTAELQVLLNEAADLGLKVKLSTLETWSVAHSNSEARRVQVGLEVYEPL